MQLKKNLFLVMSAASLVIMPAANAATVTFTQFALASGTLGSYNFSNELVTFSGLGDTNNVSAITPLIDSITGITLTVGIGANSATFLGDINITSNRRRETVGFGDGSVGSAILFNAVGPTSYDLTTSFGPISGAPTFNVDQAFATSLGDFVLTSVGNVTFEAVVGEAVVGVPEPSTWFMMIGGFGLVGTGLRRARKAVSPSIV